MEPTIDLDVSDDVCTATLGGEFDMSSTDEVHAVIAPALHQRPRVVQFDLGAVTFMDSTGIKWLLETERTVGAYGGRVTIAAMSDAVQHLFDVTGLSDHFKVAGLSPR
jgi:anti-anti-sigma factor